MAHFKQNVTEFYRWFEKYEGQVRSLMDAGSGQEATEMVQTQLKKAMGEIPFQLSKNLNSKRYTLEFMTIMDEGRKIVAFYFCDAMPASLKDKWSFYYYHPATRGTITYGSKTFGPKDFQLSVSVNKDARKVDVAVMNKGDFSAIPENERFTLLYMMLCDYLGEICVDAYVGKMSFGRVRLLSNNKRGQTLTLDGLYDYIVDEVGKQGWVRPEEIKLIASNFKSKASKNVAERQDFKEGLSYCVDLLNEEGSDDRFLTDYLKSLGIELYSICTTTSVADEKGDAARQSSVEKKLSGLLSRDKSGFMIHSISGNTHFYADFLLYDDKVLGAIKREIVETTPGCKLIEL